MEHIPAWHAAKVGMRYPARVIAVGESVLLLNLDLTLIAPGRSPTILASLRFDETVDSDRARSLSLKDSVQVVLIVVDPHPGSERAFASLPANPEWLTWNDQTVRRLARHIRETREFGLMPILADALEDAGCNDTTLLEHCRQTQIDGWRDWAVELLATQQ
ncbi:MAG: hypothetical protein C0467_18400 [Planctomycetaceae bacterium]|nr:hypothetical protein [Planctomycetaceae bacterium]